MKSISELKKAALTNAISSIDKNKRFPKKVFVESWKDYLFFDSLMIFDTCFIEVKNTLLREERASVIALINLGNVTPIDYDNPPVIYLQEDTGAKEYISDLMSKESPCPPRMPPAPISWLVFVDRYVCASDKGNWSIYCEKENDLAVFAFKESLKESAIMSVKALLKANSIKQDYHSDNRLFSFIKLVPNWSAALITEYKLENSTSQP